MLDPALWQKYNIPAPRYTVYPHIPHWQEIPPAESVWKNHVLHAFAQDAELSLYVHLPFCESAFAYCGYNKRITSDHGVEIPYIETVLKEWELYRAVFPSAPILQQVHLGGATPSFFHPEHLAVLLDRLTADSRIAADHEFSVEAHPGLTTRAHLEMLSGFGFRRISIGVYEMAPHILETSAGRHPFRELIGLTELARETGFTSINYDLVYGLPLQSPAVLGQTMDMVAAMRPERISFYSYNRVPWIKTSQRIYSEAYLPRDERQQALYLLGREQLEAMGYREIGLDHFALSGDSLFEAMETGTLHRNFLGYTPHYTRLSIGLGASAISDSWDAFIQNARTIESYQEIIRNGHLPILRGHLLTPEDQILRRHMLNILCRFETNWDLPQFQCRELEAGVARLQPLEADGLVGLFPCCLRVTEQGKPFLRLICQLLDAYRNH